MRDSAADILPATTIPLELTRKIPTLGVVQVYKATFTGASNCGTRMPIYEFECTACSERFDRLQKISDPDPDSCPNCGAAGVRRRLTAPAFRLAGSGWYETDFKKDGDRKRNIAEKPEAPKADSKSAETAPSTTSPPQETKPAPDKGKTAPVAKAPPAPAEK